MNNQEAKFILGAYRPDGRDTGDTMFTKPLAQAQSDPALGAWLEGQRKFDVVLSVKMSEIAPPAGLREAILAGTRASAAPVKRVWWANSVWLAAAAAIALVAVGTVTMRSSLSRPAAADLSAFALRDLSESHDSHVGHPPALAGVQAQLASARLPITGGLKLDLADLRKNNCRTVRVGGKEVFEVCFQRDGTWYHVYVGRRSDFAPGTIDPTALLNVRGQFASTAWADTDHVYAVVTRAGADALQRLI
jgi:hypothetical protein